ncbi:hypothetical protein KKF61_00435, partial [Patescibacteria group bacterium]|nr:hypothetical protein [Patescibacteria group bacterium]
MSEKKNKISKFKRWVLLGALFVFGVQIVAVPLLLVPQQANAIMGVGDVTFTTIVSNIWGDLKDAISKAVTTAANVAFRNMIRNFVNAFAYNMAVEVATGKKGQQPLFPTQPKELLKQTADAAAGYFLDSVARDWSTGRCDGYGASDDNKCSQDSTCQPSLLLCPKGAVPQVCSNEEKKAGTCFTECASGLNAKAFCIARGCRTIQCNKNEECPPWGMAGYPADDPRFEGMEFPPRPAAAQCMKDFTLCEPQDLTVKVKLVAWAEKQTFGVPEITSKCPLSKIVDNYEKYAKAFEEDYEKLKEQGVGESFGDLLSGNKDRFFLAEITKTFNPEATEMGAYLSIIEGTKQKAAEEAKKIEFKKLMEGELDPVETTITGEKKTPAVFIEQAQQSVFDMSGKEVLHQTGSMIADAIGTFTNTLSSKLLDRLINEGWNPFAGKKGTTGTTGLLSDVFGGSAPGITAAKILFADLQRTNYSVGGSVDVLDNISSCPDSENISSDTCVVDSRFRTAIENNMTVQDALNEGLLDGTKPFGFTSTGAEPEYYNGYPYRSLVILRKYRIIPVGWELAAKYIRDFASGTYTLSSLVSEYNNPDSPFYRLVDPNWVLKSPELYCKRKGAGERLLTSEVLRAEDTNEDNDINLYDAASAYIQRDTEYCADEQMCLAENADGSCKKFGYCVEEQPVWKFNGEGCEAQYNSCQTFNTPDGSQVSYLKDTIDADGCNVGNAGCNWYCDNWNPNISEFVCANINPVSPYNRKVIFNSNVEDCDASAEGCHQFIAHQDSGANLIWQNADLEAFDPEPGASNTDGQKDTSQPDDFYIFIDGGGWDGANYCGLRSFAVSDAYKGFTAARIKTYSNCAGSSAAPYFNGRYLQPVMVDAAYLTDSRAFTFSFYAKKVNSACTGGPLTLDVYRYIKWDGAPQEMDEYKVDFDMGSTWTRYTASVTFKNIPPNEWYLLGLPTDVIKKLIFASFIQQENEPCELIIDNIQIEEGTMSDFKIYEDNPKTHMKFMAPEMYGCTGNPETDNAICSTFAQTCSANEVGCEAYTSVSSGRVITGIISNPESCDLNNPASCDQCPAEYVGCQAYREMPITRTPRRPVRDPVSFVADTGEECPASAVGCEEYTNIEEVNLGGEGREYYSYIRMCVDEDDDKLRPYYTWEGSEEFGFQLKEYILLISDDVGDNGPCTNIAPENPAIPPALNWPNCVDGEVFDENGDGIDEDHPKATCLESEVGINPDCTEFYDEDGVRYYRLKSRVIYGSSDCKSFRNSIDGEDIIYHMIPDQGVRCSASYAGCREYKGNAGDNVRVVYTDNFEGGSVSPWIGNAVYSNESINVGGHSMLVNNNAAIPDAADALGINNNTSYIISFWAKGATADTPISFAFNTFPALIFPGQAAASAGDWKMYAIGPLYIPAGTDLTGVQLQVSAPSAFYIDNVIIREAYDNVYYIKDSYTECSGYENCDEYLDRGNNIHYLKSFTRLCQDDKVGCELFIDTNNTDKLSDEYYTLWNSPEYLRGDVDNDKDVDADDVIYLYAYLGGGPPPPLLEKADIDDDGDIDKDDAIYLHNFLSDNGPSPIPRYETKPVTNYIPSDSYRFLVNDPGKHCSSADEGCRRFGEPVFDVDGSISSFNHVY